MVEKKTERLFLMISPSEKAAIQEWRRVQPDLPSLGEAVRRLVALGLASEPEKGQGQRRIPAQPRPLGEPE